MYEFERILSLFLRSSGMWKLISTDVKTIYKLTLNTHVDFLAYLDRATAKFGGAVVYHRLHCALPPGPGAAQKAREREGRSPGP